MVQTRSQSNRLNQWVREGVVPGEFADNIPRGRPPTAEVHAQYAPGDTAHRHRLPDAQPFNTNVAEHTRRKPLH